MKNKQTNKQTNKQYSTDVMKKAHLLKAETTFEKRDKSKEPALTNSLSLFVCLFVCCPAAWTSPLPSTSAGLQNGKQGVEKVKVRDRGPNRSSPCLPTKSSFFCTQVFFDYGPSSSASLLSSAMDQKRSYYRGDVKYDQYSYLNIAPVLNLPVRVQF